MGLLPSITVASTELSTLHATTCIEILAEQLRRLGLVSEEIRREEPNRMPFFTARYLEQRLLPGQIDPKHLAVARELYKWDHDQILRDLITTRFFFPGTSNSFTYSTVQARAAGQQMICALVSLVNQLRRENRWIDRSNGWPISEPDDDEFILLKMISSRGSEDLVFP